MDYRGNISEEQMLVDIKRAGDKPFLISFVRATGTKKGSIKHATCIRSHRSRQDKKATRRNNKPKRYNKSGRLYLIDYETEKRITPFIDHIIAFNNYKVIR